MNCPQCNYTFHVEYGVYDKKIRSYTDDVVTGDCGDFFELPVELRRENNEKVYDSNRRRVFGCPSCKILFMEDGS